MTQIYTEETETSRADKNIEFTFMSKGFQAMELILYLFIHFEIFLTHFLMWKNAFPVSV